MCKKEIIPLIIIAAVGFLLYSNTFYFPFVFDDISNIVESTRIRDLSNFLDISGTRYIGFLSFALNYYVDGLNLFGYHLANILIHIANAVLVYLLVSLTFKTPVMVEKSPVNRFPWRSGPCLALIAAIIFISHPIQTQAVTYIVQRFASLASLFYLLSLVLYIRFRFSSIEVKVKSSTFIFYFLSLFSVILAMKTKEISFTLPFIIVLYEFVFFTTRYKQQADITKKRLLYLLPFLITLFIIPLSRIEAAEGVDPLGGTAVSFTRWEYLFTEFRVMVRYVRLMFLPMDQTLDYNYPIYNSFFDPQVFLSFLFLVSIFGFAVYLLLRSLATNNRYGLLGSFGLLWFFVTISIESSIIPLQNVIFEHRLYLPSVGIIISFTAALCYGFELVWKRWRVIEDRRRLILILTTCFLFINSVFVVSLSIATYNRNLVWKDNETLWADTVSKSPNKPKLHYNLGIAYMEQGQFDKAVEAYKKAIELDPVYFDAHNNLGITYQELGMYDKAIAEFKESLNINPNHFKAHHNLGLAYNNKGYIDKAIQEYREASRINPDYAETHNNLGVAYAAQGHIEDAVREYMTALKLELDSAKIHYNIANAYYSRKRLNDAAQEFQAALELEPEDAESYYGLGLVYSDLKRYPDAVRAFKAALKIKPDHSEAYNNIGNIYLMQNNVKMAIEEYKNALRLDSGNIEAYYNLASSLERTGKLEEALENYRVFVERASPEHRAVVLEVRGRIDKLSRNNNLSDKK